MMNRGTLLGVEGAVNADYDVPKGAGYGVKTELTLEGTPDSKSVMDSVWASIEEAGDLPVYVEVRLTYAGHEWPWTEVVSKFDVEYQAVHMAEGSTLLAIAVLIINLLPLVAEFIFILLKLAVVAYLVLKAIDVAEWLAAQGPAVVAGIGAGIVIVAGLILLGGDKK